MPPAFELRGFLHGHLGDPDVGERQDVRPDRERRFRGRKVVTLVAPALTPVDYDRLDLGTWGL
jgi:hypothetical protein